MPPALIPAQQEPPSPVVRALRAFGAEFNAQAGKVLVGLATELPALVNNVIVALIERILIERDRLEAEYPDGDLWPWLRGLTAEQAHGLRSLAEDGDAESFVCAFDSDAGRDVLERIVLGLPPVGDGLHTVVSGLGDPLVTVEDIPEAGHLWAAAARRVHEVHADRVSGATPRADVVAGHSLDGLRPDELLRAAMAASAPADHGQSRGIENVRKRARRMAEKRQADATLSE